MALSNPFKKSTDARSNLRGAKAAEAAKDALATVRSNASKRLATVTDASKKALAKARAASHALAIKAKEPIMGIAHDEGVRMGGHAGAYALDRFVPIRGAKSGILNILLRPATGFALLSFIGAAATKGETRFYARSVGQGALHHVEAVSLRALDRAFGGTGDGAMGEGEGDTGDATDADV